MAQRVNKHDISIHAAREGGDRCGGEERCCVHISIHAAREGGDVPLGTGTLSLYEISIHAAREGGDTTSAQPWLTTPYFNPRRP